MSPEATIATATDIYTARLVLDALKAAGWIVVDKGAIGRAQREAVRQWREDCIIGLADPLSPPRAA